MPQHAAACRSTCFLELHMGVLKHAAACRSMPQHLFFGAAHGGFEACRSMPQHAAASQNFHVADFFFFIPRRKSEPFVAQVSQNSMVAQW
jgi:hypothetical protein